jgi:hypothetical protein
VREREGGDLIAEALPSPGGHEDEDVATGECSGDGLRLAAAEVGVAEVLAQECAGVVNSGVQGATLESGHYSVGRVPATVKRSACNMDGRSGRSDKSLGATEGGGRYHSGNPVWSAGHSARSGRREAW